LILLSGFIFSLQAIPEIVRPLACLIPFTYFVQIVRGLLIKQTLFIDLASAYLALLAFMFVFVAASIFKFRRTL
jgi:ABC-2 type transport system permease protein